MPSSDWPPPATTDEGTSLTTPVPTVPPVKTPLGELAPGAELTQGDEGIQPQDDGAAEGDEEEEPSDEQPDQPETE
jgi:hypothetical protein